MADPLLDDFCLPIDLSRLENDRMKLVSFEVSHIPQFQRCAGGTEMRARAVDALAI